jgi:D-threo-aldose 1-dehydrogenase
LSVRRRLGRSALEIPAFGFGAAHLGELYAPVPEDEARATLAAAWDGGVRLYDTAPWYGRGLSEHRLGGFLRTRPRDDFVLTTKVGRTLRRPPDPRRFDRAPWAGGLNFDVDFDYSYDGIMRSYEQALQRLALDTVDALVIHDLDAGHHGAALAGHLAALEAGGLRALEALRASGEIRAVGVGVNTRAALDEVARRIPADFVLVAMPYTLLDQEALHGGLARCRAEGIGVVIGAPFASGVLATGSAGGGRYGYAVAPPAVQEKVRRIEAVCAVHGVALAAAALQFPLAHPAVAAVIPGAARAAEVCANLAAVAAPIPPAFWSDLRAEGLIDPAAPVPA